MAEVINAILLAVYLALVIALVWMSRRLYKAVKSSREAAESLLEASQGLLESTERLGATLEAAQEEFMDEFFEGCGPCLHCGTPMKECAYHYAQVCCSKCEHPQASRALSLTD